MPSNTSVKTATTTTKQSQPTIHPLFRKSQFLGNIDYDKVFRGPAILATRLLNTPQALHWAYAFLFGRNVDIEMPERAEGAPELINDPRQYACDRAIGQLSPEDLTDVRVQLADLAHRCHFRVGDDLEDPSAIGETGCSKINSQYAIITIHGSLYRRALPRNSYTQAENALIDLDLAMLMLHEVAHALNVYYMLNYEDDFFEGSLIAEHGYELESRIFGLLPHIPASAAELTTGCTLYPWQTKTFIIGSSKEPCRDVSKLPRSSPHTPLDPEFAVKLCGDEFWEGEYLQHGAIAIIPAVVQNLCRAGKRDITTNAIPPSIRELFRETNGRNLKSYAKRRYPDFANPRRFFRKPYVSDDEDGENYEEEEPDADGGANTEDDDEEIPDADTGTDTEVDWSEGESTDASGYNTEDMSNYSDDEAMVRGSDSDNEMTEVEEWVPRPPKPVIKAPVIPSPFAKAKPKEMDDFDFDAALLEIQKADATRAMGRIREIREREERKYAFFH